MARYLVSVSIKRRSINVYKPSWTTKWVAIEASNPASAWCIVEKSLRLLNVEYQIQGAEQIGEGYELSEELIA